jgi:hypothetical protein
MKKAPLILFSVILTVSVSLNAGYCDPASDAVIKSANDILRQPVSARTLAIADAFTGLTDDISAISYNPAGLARLTSSEMAAMYGEQEFTSLNYGFFGFSFHFSDLCNLGLSGNIRNSLVSGHDYVYTLSYALKVMERPNVGVTTFGVNLRYLESGIAEDSSIYAYVGDVGILSTIFVADKPLGIGLCMQNYGGGIKYGTGENAGEILPLIGRGGIAYTFGPEKEKPISVSADVAYVEGTLEPKYSAGMEWWITPGVALRLGYKVNYDIKDTLTMGMGLKYGTIRFDYALIKLDNMVDYTPKISFLCKF